MSTPSVRHPCSAPGVLWCTWSAGNRVARKARENFSRALRKLKPSEFRLSPPLRPRRPMAGNGSRGEAKGALPNDEGGRNEGSGRTRDQGDELFPERRLRLPGSSQESLDRRAGTLHRLERYFIALRLGIPEIASRRTNERLAPCEKPTGSACGAVDGSTRSRT